jgi:hypothetical protein
VQSYHYFVSQSSKFCLHKQLCCFSTSVYCCKLYFFIDSVRKFLDTASYTSEMLLLHKLDILSANRTITRDWNEIWGFHTAVKMQVEVLWVVTPYSDVVGYQRFRVPCCLHPIRWWMEAAWTSQNLVPHHITIPRHSLEEIETSQPWKPQNSHLSV